MIYLSGHILAAAHPDLGFMLTPRGGRTPPPEALWAADTGRFLAPESYTDEGYLRWLERQDVSRSLFATAPDSVADHRATVELALPMLPQLRALGYPAAFVAQDGFHESTTPWDAFDVLFIGGTTAFKLSCGDVIGAARRRGKAVHMGRVNSYRRLRVAAAMGCETADGTFLRFAPDGNMPRLMNWLAKLQPMLPI